MTRLRAQAFLGHKSCGQHDRRLMCLWFAFSVPWRNCTTSLAHKLLWVSQHFARRAVLSEALHEHPSAPVAMCLRISRAHALRPVSVCRCSAAGANAARSARRCCNRSAPRSTNNCAGHDLCTSHSQCSIPATSVRFGPKSVRLATDLGHRVLCPRPRSGGRAAPSPHRPRTESLQQHIGGWGVSSLSIPRPRKSCSVLVSRVT